MFVCYPEITQLCCFRGELYLRKVELNDKFCLYFERVALLDSPKRANASLSRLHDNIESNTPHWVGILWTSDRPVAGTST
jgi:hypothetical protein